MYSSIIISVASIGLAVLFYSQASTYPLAASRLPMLLAWVVGGLAALVIVEELLRARRSNKVAQAAAEAAPEAAPAPDDNAVVDSAIMPILEAEDEGPKPIVWSAALPFAAGIIAYVTLIPYVGYLLVTPVFIALGLAISGTLRWVPAILVALGMTALVWVVFIWALYMPIQLVPAFFE